MKNILAENLLRFGAKNISEDVKKKLAEQTVTVGPVSTAWTPKGINVGMVVPLEDIVLTGTKYKYFEFYRAEIDPETKKATSGGLQRYSSNAFKVTAVKGTTVTAKNQENKDVSVKSIVLDVKSDGGDIALRFSITKNNITQVLPPSKMQLVPDTTSSVLYARVPGNANYMPFKSWAQSSVHNDAAGGKDLYGNTAWSNVPIFKEFQTAIPA